MIAYPTTLDDAPAVVMDAYATRKFTSHHLRAVQHMQLYATGMLFPDPPGPLGNAAGAGKVMAEDEMVQCLNLLASTRAHAALAIDWRSVLLTLLPLAAAIIKQLLGI